MTAAAGRQNAYPDCFDTLPEITAYAGYPEIQASIMRPVEAAAERLAITLGSGYQTPLLYSPEYSAEFGCQVYLKDETANQVGSFKQRGAANKAMQLSQSERENGLVTVSAGNHAQGVALVAQRLGVAATVFMPEGTNRVKQSAVRELGARVITIGSDFAAAQTACEAHRREHPEEAFIHPFDDFDVVAGQGTLGKEIFDVFAGQKKQPTHIFGAVGGGGQVAGLTLAAQEAGCKANIFGVEPAGAAAYAASFRRGRRVRLPSVDTAAEGAAVVQLGAIPYEIMTRTGQVRPVTVSEEELEIATLQVNEQFTSPVEFTGALALAGAARYGRDVGFKPSDVVVAVISGAHLNQEHYQRAQQKHAVAGALTSVA